MHDRKVIVVTTGVHKRLKAKAMELELTMLELCEMIFNTYFTKVETNDENN